MDSQGSIALDQLNLLLEHCQGLEVTFHMAIDRARDILAAARAVASTSVTRVLSAGGGATAGANAEVLRQMRDILAQTGVLLLAGKGVNPENCQTILQTTGADELHVGTSVRPGKSPFSGVDQQLVEKMAQAYRQAGVKS